MEYNEDLLMGYSSYGEIEIEKMWKGISDLEEDHEPLVNLKRDIEERKAEVDDERLKGNITKEQEKAKKSAINRDYKKEFHKLFVKECLRPNDYEEGHGDVFAFIQSSDCGYEKKEGSDSTEYHISLMTPAMACTDYIYHNPPEEKPWWYEHYRPYYYYLTLDIPSYDTDWNDIYGDPKKGMLVEAQIYEPGKETEGGKFWQGRLSFGGSDSYTRDISIRFKKQKDKDDKLDKEEKKGVVIKLLHQYFACLKNAKTTKLKDFLDATIPNDVKAYNVKVLNVGQANCIHIKTDKNLSFLFDVGVPSNWKNKDKDNKERNSNSDYNPNGIGSSIGIIKKYKPDFVMISHLHYDHLLGFIHLCDEAIKCHWIMPVPEEIFVPLIEEDKAESEENPEAEPEEKPKEENKNGVNDITVVRFILYVLNNQKLILVRGGYGRRLYANKNYCDFEVFRGKKTLKKNDEIDLNSGSLMLRIRNALFSADCMYKDWPTALKRKRLLNKIDWLVAPHHGAFPSDETNDNIEVMKRLKGKKRSAIVCVGHNSYGHPVNAHFDNLINNDVDSIYVTGGAMDVKYQGAPAGQCTYFKSVNQSVTFTAN